MKAEITAIIPAYNASLYIGEAIESVLNQTIPCRLIIVDDASGDGTYAIAKSYEQSRPERIQVIRNQKNAGVANARNVAMQQADTEYLAFLDADDWWSPEKLEVQLELMKKTNASLCYTGRELMRQDGSPSGKTIRVPEEISYRKLLKGNVIPCSSILVRREDALEYPMVHDELHEDYIMWLSMLRDGRKFVGINEPFLKSRLAEQGKSRNKKKSARMTYQVYRYMGIPVWQAVYYFCCYAWNGWKKYAGKILREK